ncbi:hypothetical protein TTHT_0449 [Thermotomaculum hydrothermale]|uniref:Peptidase C1A papain C-terminal domain-containing protein n=1 Tax=Thermotomaculum hydrothermale TaxID=981385 RepID=A0A7R6PE67_9BACT|nr:hypothetical protein [Thermotomaculum hydrothermale]BBB32043.1 hypothetical protein TTHT_0449 [Thermotomaculum hydrothermale]
MKKIFFILALIFISHILIAETTEVVEITTRPWNGYWWPNKEGALCSGKGYNGFPTPMEKYDLAFNQPYLATQWELENHYQPDGEGWWGHCNGWAAAAILEQEPTHKCTYNSIVFYVGDLKGLLTECYQGADAGASFYGTRYDGDDNQEAFEDINPLDLQNVLEMYLKDNNMSILLDTDPSKEVWTYPVFKYELSYTDENNIRHCTLKIYCATDSYDDGILDPDDSGDTHVYTRTYTYDLTLNSNGEPISGEWTGDSVNDHPDFAWYPETIESANPYVNLDNVHEIMNHDYTQEDDGNEPDNSFEEANKLDTNLIYRILNDDYFTFFIEPGENIDLNIYFNDYQNYALGRIYDKDENFIDYVQYDSNYKSAHYNFSALDNVEDYFLKVEYPIIGYYNDNYSLKITENNKKIIIPHTLNTAYWDNFLYAAFIPYRTVNSETQEETEYTSTTGSLVGVFDTHSQLISKDININSAFQELPFTVNDEVPQWVKLNSDNEHIKILSFYQSEGEGSMGYFYSIAPAKRFVLPHVPPEIHYWWYGLVIVNPSHFKKIRVNYKLYDYNKQVLKEGYFDIPQYGKIVDVFENLFPDTNMDDTSYLEFSSSDKMVVSALYGTRDHRELAYVPADSNFIKKGDKFYFTKSMMPQSENPWAGIAIVNPSDSLNATLHISIVDNHNTYTRYNITLNPHEKKVDVMENFVPENINFSDVERIEFEVTNGEVSAFALYGDHDKGTLASCLPIGLNSGMITTYFPYITNHNLNTTLFLKNENNYSAQVKVYAINENGDEIEDITLDLTNFELKEVNISSAFSNPDQIKTLKVYSSKFITPFAVLKSPDEKFYEIIGPDFTKQTIIEQTQ